jgi:hypothetical protein
MKRLISLQLGYETGPAVRAKALKQFRDEIKKLASVKIVKELESKAQVIIELPDERYQEVYEAMCKMDVVQTIEAVQPSDEQ